MFAQAPFRCCARSGSNPHNYATPLAVTALVLVWSCTMKKEGPEQALSIGQGMGCVVPAQARVPDCSLSTALTPFRFCARSEWAPSLKTVHSPWP